MRAQGAGWDCMLSALRNRRSCGRWVRDVFIQCSLTEGTPCWPEHSLRSYFTEVDIGAIKTSGNLEYPEHFVGICAKREIEFTRWSLIRLSSHSALQMERVWRDRAWSIMNLAVFVTPAQRLFSTEMCLNIGPAPLVRAFLQPWLWIMTFSCWKWKLCREMVLSAPLAGLELRRPARLARCGIPLPASLLSPHQSKDLTLTFAVCTFLHLGFNNLDEV